MNGPRLLDERQPIRDVHERGEDAGEDLGSGGAFFGYVVEVGSRSAPARANRSLKMALRRARRLCGAFWYLG